jgi:hypothetical protein
MPRTALVFGAVLILANASSLLADPPRPAELEAPQQNAAPKQAAAAAWHLESVVLKSGRTYRGLIESVGPDAIKFVQIIRPGMPEMSIAPRKIWRNVVARSETLLDDEHDRLADLVREYRSSDRFEGGQLKRLMLMPARRAGWAVSRYRGQYFLLDSSADENTTRRSIVQMEQIFGAYEMMLPPREKPKSKLAIVLWGSPAQYHALLARRGADMANPAFYSPEENTVMAGLELPRLVRQLNNVRNFRDHVEQGADENHMAMVKSGKRKKQQQLPPDVRDEMNRSRQEQFEMERGQLLRNLEMADKRASENLQQASQRTFAMLYHEAFHAYLENYVYPHDQFDVPRWLNEGLAQIFENGRLDGDTLHFDGPAPMLLAQLRHDMATGQRLSIDELLKSDQQGFLVTRPGDAEVSHRSYLYSWGVAQYLMQELNLLGTPAMDEYVSKHAAQKSPRERFERLVGESLETFEANWRQFILGQDAPRRFGVRPAGVEQAELPRPRDAQ